MPLTVLRPDIATDETALISKCSGILTVCRFWGFQQPTSLLMLLLGLTDSPDTSKSFLSASPSLCYFVCPSVSRHGAAVWRGERPAAGSGCLSERAARPARVWLVTGSGAPLFTRRAVCAARHGRRAHGPFEGAPRGPLLLGRVTSAGASVAGW